MSVDGGSYAPTGETLLIECDQVLSAIGQSFELADSALIMDLDGRRIKVDEERRSSDAKIWAGGDCVAGGEDLTVAAVQDGKVAAESIHKVLKG